MSCELERLYTDGSPGYLPVGRIGWRRPYSPVRQRLGLTANQCLAASDVPSRSEAAFFISPLVFGSTVALRFTCRCRRRKKRHSCSAPQISRTDTRRPIQRQIHDNMAGSGPDRRTRHSRTGSTSPLAANVNPMPGHCPTRRTPSWKSPTKAGPHGARPQTAARRHGTRSDAVNT